MARLVITELFLEQTADVTSPRVLARIQTALTTLVTFPRSGSPDVPASLRERFGEDIRKVVVRPFDLVYLYDKSKDEVCILGLVHGRLAR